jgi:hypothetical protein
MSKEERARLDALAKSLVSGLPIAATVTYHADTDRLYIDCKALPDRSCGRAPAELGNYTSVSDHPNLEQFVRDEIANFLSSSGPWKVRNKPP